MERPLQGADGADDRGHQVGTRRGDDTRRERRRVETMIDHGVQVGLERSHPLGIRLFPGQHVEVVRRVAQFGVRQDRIQPAAEPGIRRDNRGYARDDRRRFR